MKPLKLTMSAFGSYGRITKIDFEAIDHGIFLITGDTGAGKTTIFDGISFALYGEASGAGRDGSMMRSQYASEEEETYVELIFSDKGQTYQIKRSPSYQRISRRKNKAGNRTMTTVPAKASLILPDGTEFPGRMNEINLKIQEIVGVDRNQFSQIAMIAQGEYLKLLHASSKERKEIFSRIFNTGIYLRVQQKLKEKNYALSGMLSDNKNLYEYERSQVSLEEGDTRLEEWQIISPLLETKGERIEQLLSEITEESKKKDETIKQAAEALISRLSQQNNQLDQAQERNKRLQEKKQAEKRLKLLEEAANAVAEKEKIWKAAAQAEPVWAAEALYREQELELDKTNRKIQNLIAELADLKESEETARADLKEKEERLKKEQPGLIASLAKLEEILPAYVKLSKKRKELEQAEEKRRKYSSRESDRKREFEQLQEEIKTLKQEQDRYSGSRLLLSEALQRERKWNERSVFLEELIHTLEIMERLHLAKEEQKIQVADLQNAYTKASSEYDKKSRLFIAVQAGIMASRLETGMPCPVCGSLSHPRKALLKAEDVTEQQVEAAKAIREQAENKLKQAAAEGQRLNVRYETLKEQAAEQSGKILKEIEIEFPNLLEKFKKFWTEQKARQDASQAEPAEWKILMLEALHACQDAYNDECLLRKQLERQAALWEKNKQILEKKEAKRGELEELVQQAQVMLADALLILQKVELEVKQLRTALPWECEAEALAEQNRLKKKKQFLEALVTEAEQLDGQLRNTATEKKGFLLSAQENQLQLKEKIEGNKQKWQCLIKEQGFSSEEEYRKAVLEKEEKERLAKEIAAFEKELLKARTVYRQYEKLTKGQDWIDEEQIKEEIKRLSEERVRLTSRSVELSAARGKNEAALKNIRKILKERAGLQKQMQLVETLYSTADGKISKAARIDFQTYVQRQYFKQMAAAANRRLARMAGGQFLLQCRGLETLGKQGEVGLDLDVYCIHSDQTRDVKTLSGGESFIAALAMALGMADVIQNTAGKVSIDAMFIDEGFGALDEDARMKAIEILKELSGGQRLVGIISHVTELKEQLGRKLAVKKSEKGSSVKWELDD